MDFNTAVSALMIFVNHLYKEEVRDQNVAKTLVRLLMPFAPHLAEEIWEFLGGEGLVSLASWPKYDKKQSSFRREDHRGSGQWEDQRICYFISVRFGENGR